MTLLAEVNAARLDELSEPLRKDREDLAATRGSRSEVAPVPEHRAC